MWNIDGKDSPPSSQRFKGHATTLYPRGAPAVNINGQSFCKPIEVTFGKPKNFKQLAESNKRVE